MCDTQENKQLPIKIVGCIMICEVFARIVMMRVFIYTCICICLNTHAHTHIYIHIHHIPIYIYIRISPDTYIYISIRDNVQYIYIYCIILYYVMLYTHMITYVYNMYTSYQSFAGIPLAQVCDLCVWSSAVINPQTWPLDGFKGTS